MIDQVDARLIDWVTTVTGGVAPSLAPPSPTNAPAPTDSGVSLYLLELSPTPASPVSNNGARRLPLQIVLNYLVTTWAKEPQEAHRLLSVLAFAAMEVADFEVKLDPIPLAAWAAFPAQPRPSFILRVPLRLERPETPVKLVRKQIHVAFTPLVSLSGIVLTPDDVPVAGANVILPALNLSGHTDGQGRFYFPAVPVEPNTKLLSIRAKGQEQSISITPDADNNPVVVRFQI